eukprot:scaffold5112_cov96-Isochrysis_galbana.AAC.2
MHWAGGARGILRFYKFFFPSSPLARVRGPRRDPSRRQPPPAPGLGPPPRLLFARLARRRYGGAGEAKRLEPRQRRAKLAALRRGSRRARGVDNFPVWADCRYPRQRHRSGRSRPPRRPSVGRVSNCSPAGCGRLRMPPRAASA